MKKIERDLLISKAKKRVRRLEKLREDPRYEQVMGRLKHEGLLDSKTVRAHRRKFLLEEALWVGENLEPRVLELLPAIILKRPGLMLFEDLPQDLKTVVAELRRGQAWRPFRGIEAPLYVQWVPRVGRKGRLPRLTKTFRFSSEDQARLRELSQIMKMTETETISEALRRMARST